MFAAAASLFMRSTHFCDAHHAFFSRDLLSCDLAIWSAVPVVAQGGYVMCFGPVPSFVASGVLTGVGIANIAQTRRRNELLFAALPFFFALQQLDEGLLWLALRNGAPEETIHLLSLVFLLIAFCFWPICTPTSIYLLEDRPKNRKQMAFVLAVGVLFAAYCFVILINGDSSADISRQCIHYRKDIPRPNALILPGYVFSVFAAFFLSSRRELAAMGLINLVAAGIVNYIVHFSLVSVWCFFAALWSTLTWLVLRDLHSEVPRSWRFSTKAQPKLRYVSRAKLVIDQRFRRVS